MILEIFIIYLITTIVFLYRLFFYVDKADTEHKISFHFTQSFSPRIHTGNFLTLAICPVFANSADPDLKKPTDLDLHCLPISM